MSDEAFGVGPDSQIPEALWEQMRPVLPPPKPKKKDGRPRMDDRQAITVILYILRTGCQWKALPRSLGASSTLHDRFQAWRRAGVFAQLWTAGLLTYAELKGLEWAWQAMDGAMTKAPPFATVSVASVPPGSEGGLGRKDARAPPAVAPLKDVRRLIFIACPPNG